MSDDDSRDQAFLRWALAGDEQAVALINDLFALFQVWDDLIDGDSTSQARIHRAFTAALITIPRNGFFQRFAGELQPLIEAAIIDWKTANAFERGSHDERVLAFVLREHVAQIVIRAAWCLGGHGWAEQVAPAVWRANHDGTLHDYLRELAQ
jgi:hypothetical protein